MYDLIIPSEVFTGTEICLSLLPLSTSLESTAMLPASHYLRAQRTADWHVQVELLKVPTVASTPATATVHAKIVRIFRATSPITLGEELTFGVSVIRPDDEMPASGIIWTDYDQLTAARFMEVFLNSTTKLPHCEVALWQSRLIDQPSDKPCMAL